MTKNRDVPLLRIGLCFRPVGAVVLDATMTDGQPPQTKADDRHLKQLYQNLIGDRPMSHNAGKPPRERADAGIGPKYCMRILLKVVKSIEDCRLTMVPLLQEAP